MTRIKDDLVRARYEFATDVIEQWISPYLRLTDSEILDFGCGDGITALGLIGRKNARQVVGVDIMPDVERCEEQASIHLGLDRLPSNLELYRIVPGADFCPGRVFDFIYAWSVFEHVEQTLVMHVLRQLRDKLKDGGYLFVQIAPLYYSFDGSHIAHKIPGPWAHLECQQSILYRKLCLACDSDKEVESLWSCYQWLNKMTVKVLLRSINRAGLKIIKKTSIKGAQIPPRELSRVYKKSVLMTNQVLVVAKKEVHSTRIFDIKRIAELFKNIRKNSFVAATPLLFFFHGEPSFSQEMIDQQSIDPIYDEVLAQSSFSMLRFPSI